MMKEIKIKELEDLIFSILNKAGLKEKYCNWVTEIFMRATYRGVGHHDIYSLPGRIKNINEGRINKNPDIIKTAKFNALEIYDGDNGLGELNCYFITDRSLELADKYGLGLVSIKNSNHFLAAAPYVELAAEKGYLSLIFSSVGMAMGIGDSPKIIGNGPMGYSTQSKNANILFDICMAYSSYGKLNAKKKAGEKTPKYWGKDKKGNYTEQPAEIINGGVPLPIGEHKGFGLSLMIELITSILAEGDIGLDKKENNSGTYTHSIITIKPETVSDKYKDNIDKLINDMKNKYPQLHIPGEGSYNNKEEIQEKGYFELEESLLNKLSEENYI